jgi:hypothetical protein|tara:strand:- start:5 stop:550 length:546 start_codon:yes stop_codon:yes gene_type:complete
MAISWASAGVDPKRRFKFKLKLGTIAEYYVKTATMPKANISVIEHSYFDYTFKFPGRVTWDPISVTLVAPSNGAEDPTDLLYQFIREAGYYFPDEATPSLTSQSLSKKGFEKAFGGKCYLQLLDGNGNEIEEWQLRNPFLTNVDYGGSLDYTSDEMLELSLEITFDWAQKTQSGGGANPTP